MTRQPVLTIAGSDCSGGAGIQADIKTITVLGGYGMSAITALTAQNTIAVQGILPVPADFLKQQLESICSDIPPLAVKIGMVYDIPQIQTIVEVIQRYQLPHVVVDPVMIATSGTNLIRTEAVQVLETKLLPLASLITPNIPEAQAMTGLEITSPGQMEQAAAALSRAYGTAILLKGGHCVCTSNDLLYCDGEPTWIPGQKIPTDNTHGTGCTLSSAIAVFLAQGFSLEHSVRRAKNYITHTIQAGLTLGHGNGPIAHNYRIGEVM